jgi:hypothetical protein
MPQPRIIMAAFDQGAMPTITCVNKATEDLGVDFNALVQALQKFLDECFAPIWGTPAKITQASDPQPGTWTMAFLDDADQAGVLGYHELTLDGLPISKVFVKTTLAIGDKVSVTAAHELAEMMVDPAINLWSQDSKGTFYAYEMCDAVESEEFLIDGVAMSDFVYPAYFESFRKPNSTQFDYLKKVTQPFQILKGGYSIVQQAGGEATQIFGSAAKRRAFAKEDRHLHRSEYRKNGLGLGIKPVKKKKAKAKKKKRK